MRPSPYRVFGGLAAAGIVVIGLFCVFTLGLNGLIAYILAVNLITFLYYAYDKAVAGSALWRVPERVLHVLAFVGAAPAALAGQKLLRHKTVKASFQATFWLIVAVQVVIIALLLYYYFVR